MTPKTDSEEAGNLASDLIANAQKSIDLAKSEGAKDYSSEELSQAEQLLGKAEEAFKKRKYAVAEDLAFLADTEGEIAIARTKETKAKIQTAKNNGEEIKLVLEIKANEAATAKARQSIAELMMLKAQKDSERTKDYSDKEIQKARAELAIAKVELMLSLADQVTASKYAEKNYRDAKSALQRADNNLKSGNFQDAMDNAEEAEKYASNSYVEARAKSDSEKLESLKARDKAVEAIAKAKLSVEQAKENRLVNQFSKDVLEKAEKSLKDADSAFKTGDYEKAESLAQQTLLTASNAQAVALAKEREIKNKESQEDAKANAMDILAKLEKIVSQLDSLSASEVAAESYKETQSVLERAKQAMLKQNYEEAASLGKEGITHSAIALALAEAKSELKKKTEAIEKNINEEASKIPETTARKTNKGIVISLTGDIFTQNNKIKNEAQDRMKQLAGILKKYPDYKIVIEGHTDDKGSDETNLKTSSEKAYNFMQYLVTQEGIPLDILSSVGVGKLKPLVPNIDDESRRQNRRIDVLIIPILMH